MTFLIDHILQPEFGKTESNGTKTEFETENKTKNIDSKIFRIESKSKCKTELGAENISRSCNAEFQTDATVESQFRTENKINIAETRVELSCNITESSADTKTEKEIKTESTVNSLPAWIFCTRYSDRPSCSGKLLILGDF